MRGSAVFRTGIAPGGALAGPWVRNPLWTRARAVPSLDLRFADNKSLVDAVTGAQLVTFTRASSGTFVGSDGVLRTAVTNLCLQSQAITISAPWGFSSTAPTIAANAFAAPDGTTTATRITFAAADSRVSQGSIPIVNGRTYTLSVFAQPVTPGTLNVFRLAVFDTVSQLNSSDITLTANWQRVSFTFTSTGTGNATIQFRNLLAANIANDVYLWGAQLQQSSTVGEYIPTTSAINSAPRFDHNPTTGESLGLLVEEARTNSIANNTGVGAVAGAPGTLPTNWTWNTAGGASTEVVGTGTENGIAYVDVRVFGTLSSAPSIQFVANTAIAATTGQAWTESFYCKIISLVSGTPDPRLRIVERSGAGSYLTEGNQPFTPGISSASLIASRFTFTRTLTNALTGYVIPALLLNQSSGAIDITLRIGLPQLEQGAFATSAIPTTTATVTRAADVATISNANLLPWFTSFNEHTFYAELRGEPPKGPGGIIMEGLVSGAIGGATLALNNTSTRLRSQQRTGPSRFDAGNNNGSLLNNTINRVALGVSALGSQSGENGLLPTTSSAPAQADWDSGSALSLGKRSTSNSVFLNGCIARFAYFPTRLGNEVLPRITQP